MLEQLKEDVCKANLDLVKYGLVVLTWGNVSGIDRAKRIIVIKPSGVDYDKLTPGDMVVVDLDGKVVEGNMRPSSDTPTHIELYKAFPEIGGITHTHSGHASAFAQACKEIPCLGTTHADSFFGPVPVTRFLTEDEVESGYEKNTGKIIIERFKDLDPISMPGILVAGHGPFCWGQNAEDSVKNSLMLEQIAGMALDTVRLDTNAKALPDYILDKHHERKHGKSAYYGQKK
ncbi:MAG: L-ribulose-5-phosphate 4-epimerase [Candidatus Kryptoniota bacterium]